MNAIELENKISFQKKLTKKEQNFLKDSLINEVQNNKLIMFAETKDVKFKLKDKNFLLGFIDNKKFSYTKYMENNIDIQSKNTISEIICSYFKSDHIVSKKYEDNFSNNKISSIQSVEFEDFVKKVKNQSFTEIKNEYPKLFFEEKTTLSKTEINLKLSLLNPLLGKEISNEKSCIKPDGGLLYLKGKDKKYLICVSEAKKQGTNDLREEDGKNQQAMGNAVERAYKNYVEISNYVIDEDICPYILFLNGCDFVKGSSILDRLTGLTKGTFFNQVNTFNSKIGNKSIPLASIFISDKIISNWTSTDYENYTNLFKLAYKKTLKDAIEYYINKYPKDFSLT